MAKQRSITPGIKTETRGVGLEPTNSKVTGGYSNKTSDIGDGFMKRGYDIRNGARMDKEDARLFWCRGRRTRDHHGECRGCKRVRRIVIQTAQGLEILRNAGISRPRVNTRILNARVPACLDVPDDGLVVITTIGTVSVHIAIVGVIPVVASRRVARRHVAFLRGLGMVGSRVRRRSIRGSSMNVTRAGVGRNGDRTQHANGFNDLARVRASAIRILHSAFAGARGVVVGAASIRHGHAHAAGQVRGGFTTGRGGTPAAVSGGSVVLGGDTASGHHTWQSGIIVRVEAVFFDFLAALFLGSLVRLALAPEPECR